MAADGAFELAGLEPGRYLVEARAAGYAADRREARLEAGRAGSTSSA